METLLSERDTSPDSLVQFGLIPCIGEMMMINLMDDASVWRYTPAAAAVSSTSTSSTVTTVDIFSLHRSIISLHSSISSVQLVSPIHHLSSMPSSLRYWHLNSNTSACSSWVCWPFLQMCTLCQQMLPVAVEVQYIWESLLLSLHLCPHINQWFNYFSCSSRLQCHTSITFGSAASNAWNTFHVLHL